MMPKSVRGLLKVRRTCRKKIHERITAVSGGNVFLLMITLYLIWKVDGCIVFIQQCWVCYKEQKLTSRLDLISTKLRRSLGKY